MSACPFAAPVLRRLDNGVGRTTFLSRPIVAVVMKTVNESEVMRSCLTAAWILAGALVLGAPVAAHVCPYEDRTPGTKVIPKAAGSSSFLIINRSLNSRPSDRKNSTSDAKTPA